MSDQLSGEPDFKALFEGGPGLYMVLDPDLRIVAASDAYLRTTLTRREEIVGKDVFEVFPDNPDDPSADAVLNSRASFNRVLQHRVTDVMVVQRHDVRRPESEGGGFEVRYWSPINSPILNSDGSLAYILHRVENVTEFVRLREQGVEQAHLTDALTERTAQMEADLYARSREVAEANRRLKELNETLEQRVAERTRSLQESEDRFRSVLENSRDAIYRLNVQAGRFEYISPASQAITGYSPDELMALDPETSLSMIHPDDVSAMRAAVARLEDCGDGDTEYRQRTKSGEYRWISNHMSLIRDSAGKPLYRVGNLRDITASKEAEEAVRRNEAMLRAVLEQMPSGVTVRDAATGELVLSNIRGREILGKLVDLPGEFTTRYRGLHPDGRPYRTEEWPVNRSMATGEVVNAEEIECERSDGTRIILSFSSAPVMDARGRITGGVAVFHDITKRRRAEDAVQQRNEELAATEEELRCQNEELTVIEEELLQSNSDLLAAQHHLQESEEKYRSMAENVPSVLMRYDPEMRVVYLSPQAERATGVPTNQFIGRTNRDAGMPGNLCDLWETAIAEAFRTGEPRDLEFDFPSPDGPRTFYLKFAPEFGPEGEVQHVLGISTDITERKKAEELLRYHANLVETVSDAIISTDTELKIRSWNRAAEEMYGWRADEVLGTVGSDILRTEFPEGSGREALARDLFEKGSWQGELIQRTRDGRPIIVEATSIRLTDDAGTVIGAVSISRNVTERRRAEEALRRYAEDLQRSNEDLERFAYVSSHDLQEPLRSIVSFSQLLERRYRGRLDSDADDYIGFIVEGGIRMQTLIQDLLAYSRVNTTRQELARTDTADVLASVERSLDVQLREAVATITHDPMPVVMADPLQLEQVFANLTSNAIKFRRPEEPLQIRVGARRIDGFWEFSVSDNGIGIDPEYFDRIFVIFQRLHTKETYPGTGIGLAIVKRIIDRHGGTIRVESRPGEGSTFFFTLPAA